MTTKASLLVLLLLSSAIVNATLKTVKVQLFNQFNLKTVVVTPIEGKYQITTDNGLIIKLKKIQLVYFTAIGDSISLWDQAEHIGVFSTISFRGLTRYNNFKIESVYPNLPSREYEGDLQISARNNHLSIANFVNINDYLSGVVEAEAGPNAPFEFYKVQAIISRTYLMEIVHREGANYFVGDDVNFQVYKNRCYRNPAIKQAVIQTSNLIIIDSTNSIILAAFHSNSGGFTANSEDVWLKPASYLKATPDPFSHNQKNSIWRDTITIQTWLKYLNDNGVTNKELEQMLMIDNPQRVKYLLTVNDSLTMRKIRKDFNLRSAWFSIKPEGSYIIIDGKGYGHGVGLSQEGGMQMARENHSFSDIITYYYKNVKVVNYDSVFNDNF